MPCLSCSSLTRPVHGALWNASIHREEGLQIHVMFRVTRQSLRKTVCTSTQLTLSQQCGNGQKLQMSETSFVLLMTGSFLGRIGVSRNSSLLKAAVINVMQYLHRCGNHGFQSQRRPQRFPTSLQCYSKMTKSYTLSPTQHISGIDYRRSLSLL